MEQSHQRARPHAPLRTASPVPSCGSCTRYLISPRGGVQRRDCTYLFRSWPTITTNCGLLPSSASRALACACCAAGGKSGDP